MSKELVKKHSESITHNTVGSVLSYYIIQGVPIMSGLIAALSSYLRGVPLWLVILIGSVVFFLLSFTWDRIGEKLRKRKPETQDESPTAIPESEVEEKKEALNAQHQSAIETLKYDHQADADALKRNYESQTEGLNREIERLRKEVETQETRVKTRDDESKQYEWLHNMAKEQAEDIGRYVVAQVRYCYYEMNAPIPHVILAVDIYNKSVFDITIEDAIVGHIRLGGERLRGEKELIHNPKILRSGEESLTLKQRLTPEEVNLVVYCERQTLGAIYYFDALDIMIAERTEFPRFDRTRLKLPQHIGSKDKPLSKEIDSLKAQLEEEKAKRTKPDITGKITAVYSEWWANSKLSNTGRMCFDYHFAINTFVTNRGAVTTIEQFKLVLNVGERSYNGEREKEAHDVREGEQNWREWGADELGDLEKSNDVPLEYSRNGWLWFVVTGVENAKDKAEMELELYAIDKDGNSYELDTSPQPQWQNNPFREKAMMAASRARMKQMF